MHALSYYHIVFPPSSLFPRRVFYFPFYLGIQSFPEEPGLVADTLQLLVCSPLFSEGMHLIIHEFGLRAPAGRRLMIDGFVSPPPLVLMVCAVLNCGRPFVAGRIPNSRYSATHPPFHSTHSP